MFGKIINKIVFDGFDNYGVYFEKDSKYFNEITQEQIGIEDNKGNYFFAVKSGVDYEQISCVQRKVTQEYKFIFVTNCSFSAWLLNQFFKLVLTNIDPISNSKFMIKSFEENYYTKNIITNEFIIEFSGDVNNCDLEKPCCC